MPLVGRSVMKRDARKADCLRIFPEHCPMAFSRMVRKRDLLETAYIPHPLRQLGPLTTAMDGPWLERLWRQKPARLDTFVRMRMDSAS